MNQLHRLGDTLANYAKLLRPFGFRRIGHDQSGRFWQAGTDVVFLRHDPHLAAPNSAPCSGSISFCLEDRAAVDRAFALACEAGWSITSERGELWYPPGH